MRRVGPRNIVIDRLRDPDDRYSLLCHIPGRREGAVPAHDHECMDPEFLYVVLDLLEIRDIL